MKLWKLKKRNQWMEVFIMAKSILTINDVALEGTRKREIKKGSEAKYASSCARRSLLCSVPGSALEAMFSGRHQLKLKDGKVFVDRESSNTEILAESPFVVLNSRK